MQTVEAHVARMEADLKRWGAKLSELRSQGHTAGVEPNIDYHKRLDDIEVKCEAAETKLDELKAAGSAKWESFSRGVESARSELEAAIRKLAN